MYILSNEEIMQLLSKVAPLDVGRTAHLLTVYTYLGDICIKCGEVKHIYVPPTVTQKEEFKRKIKL
jgi:rRNA maturation protein Nop10